MSSETIETVLDLHSRGWMPIPIPRGSKNPNRKGWQNEKRSRDELISCFNNGQNVGILLGKPSRGLIDIDLDCREAVSIADEILPSTRMVSGRAGSPYSHRWYECNPLIATASFRDPSRSKEDERSMIAEFRSTGGQTIVPPSIHPSGELYQWYGELIPAVVSGSDLLKSVKKLAACALIARHWKYGQRHHTALALAGTLLREGWPRASVEKLISLVAQAANDEENEDRVRTVATTLERIKSGEKATGLPSLTDLIGQKVISSFQKWLGLSFSTSERKTESYSDDTIRRRCLADVKPEHVSFLWHPYIPKGKLTLIEGDPGVGKSWLTCAIATAVAEGSGPSGWMENTPGKVLMMSVEDGLADTIRPRLDSMRADVTRIEAIEGPLIFNDAGLLRLEAEIIEVRPVLVIIDPLVAYIGAGVDINKANETRAIMARLAIIAEKYSCAIIAVRHLTKGGKDRAIYRGIGSIDFTAACRSVLLVGYDPDDEARRAVVHIKHNLTEQGSAIGYEIKAGCFYWTGVSDLTASRILASANGEERVSAIKSAEDFLREVLSEGPQPAKEIQKEAREAGIAIITLNRAKQTLGVKAIKEGRPGEKGQRWLWAMPEESEDNHEPTQVRNDDNLRANGSDKEIKSEDLAEGYQSDVYDEVRPVNDNLQDEIRLCPTCDQKGVRLSHCQRCGEFLI